MNKFILGVQSHTRNIEHTIEDLIQEGFQIQAISIIMQERDDVAHSYFQKLTLIDDVIGSRIGILPVTIPEVDNIWIGGPIAAMVGITGVDETYDPANTILGGAAGGFVNAMMNIGINEVDAKFFEDAIKKGDILLGITYSVTLEKKAYEILEKHGFQNLVAIE